jgi:hypothetical protein
MGFAVSPCPTCFGVVSSCDLAWSRTLPKVLSEHAGVEGNLVYFPSSPSLTLVGRQSEHGLDDCLDSETKSAPKRWPLQHYPRKPTLMCRLCTESARAPLRSRIPPGKAAPTYHSNRLRFGCVNGDVTCSSPGMPSACGIQPSFIVNHPIYHEIALLNIIVTLEEGVVRAGRAVTASQSRNVWVTGSPESTDEEGHRDIQNRKCPRSPCP